MEFITILPENNKVSTQMNNIISYMTREMYHIIIEIISKFTVDPSLV